ncbi:MAG TPA: shikimate kinase [Armatimonadota bacterium]|nr:shikimate kinase [Armatimonadota bacterium]
MSHSSWPQHLILVGLMGAGKSSVGRVAAAILRLPFVDTDVLVENAAGRSISQICAESGEDAFRRCETGALQRLLMIPDSVVATGGGAVVRDENWDYFRAAGLVVWLKVSPEEAFRRTAYDNGRPLLAGVDRLTRLRELHTLREPHYARAHLQIEVDGLAVQDVARRVAERYEAWRTNQAVRST